MALAIGAGVTAGLMATILVCRFLLLVLCQREARKEAKRADALPDPAE